MSKIAAVLAIILLNVSPAHSQGYLTGRDLVDRCASSRSWSEGVCVGYIIGAYDAYSVLASRWGESLAPRKVSMDDLCGIVLRYLVDHRDELDEPATALVLRAVLDRFPRRAAADAPKD